MTGVQWAEGQGVWRGGYGDSRLAYTVRPDLWPWGKTAGCGGVGCFATTERSQDRHQIRRAAEWAIKGALWEPGVAEAAILTGRMHTRDDADLRVTWTPTEGCPGR